MPAPWGTGQAFSHRRGMGGVMGGGGISLPRPSSISSSASRNVGLEPGTLQGDRLRPRVPAWGGQMGLSLGGFGAGRGHGEVLICPRAVNCQVGWGGWGWETRQGNPGAPHRAPRGPTHVPIALAAAETLSTISFKLAPASARAPATCKEQQWVRDHRAPSPKNPLSPQGCGGGPGHQRHPTDLVYEDGAAQPAAPGFLQGGESAVVPHHHHLHVGPLRPCPLQRQPKVKPIPGVVLHNQEGPSCGGGGMDRDRQRGMG